MYSCELLYETEESISKNIRTETVYNRSFHSFTFSSFATALVAFNIRSTELFSVFTIHGLNNNVRDFGYFTSSGPN